MFGDFSPVSALAILQKTPPAMVLTHDQTQDPATIYNPSAGTNFLERFYERVLENSAGHLWMGQKINVPEKVTQQGVNEVECP